MSSAFALMFKETIGENAGRILGDGVRDGLARAAPAHGKEAADLLGMGGKPALDGLGKGGSGALDALGAQAAVAAVAGALLFSGAVAGLTRVARRARSAPKPAGPR